MVAVETKPETYRVAVAIAEIKMARATLQLVRDQKIKKGDVLQVSRIAGISAAKQTAQLIPLCHPLRLSSVEIDFDIAEGSLWVKASVRAVDRTGVEMEAMTAATVAALTIYDMCKGIQRDIEIAGVKLLKKSGGASGDYVLRE